MSELSERGRAFAGVEGRQTALGRLLTDLSDRVDELEGSVVQDRDNGVTLGEVQGYFGARGVKFVPWQKTALRGPVVKSLVDGEWEDV